MTPEEREMGEAIAEIAPLGRESPITAVMLTAVGKCFYETADAEGCESREVLSLAVSSALEIAWLSYWWFIARDWKDRLEPLTVDSFMHGFVLALQRVDLTKMRESDRLARRETAQRREHDAIVGKAGNLALDKFNELVTSKTDEEARAAGLAEWDAWWKQFKNAGGIPTWDEFRKAGESPAAE